MENTVDIATALLTPKWAGEFVSFTDWVARATKALSSPSDMPAVCIDAKGRRCTLGKHFMRARDEGTFPVRYFWEFDIAPSPDCDVAAEEGHETAPDIESVMKGGYQAGYPISGKVWFRTSTSEWVLELKGTINDCNFTSRHTEPTTTAPEDVAELPSLYKVQPATQPPESIDTPEFRERIDRLRRHSSISTKGRAAYRALVAEIDTKLGVRPTILYPRHSRVQDQ